MLPRFDVERDPCEKQSLESMLARGMYYILSIVVCDEQCVEWERVMRWLDRDAKTQGCLPSIS